MSAGAFMKGFANGFVNERNRRLQDQKETDQMTLQYRLKDLSDQRDRARAQREKDSASPILRVMISRTEAGSAPAVSALATTSAKLSKSISVASGIAS